MSSPDQPPPRASVPIPAAPPVKRKRSKVMQSSLELVFSCGPCPCRLGDALTRQIRARSRCGTASR